MTLSRPSLLAALKAASGIIPTRTPRPVLREALLFERGGDIRLWASDTHRGVDVLVTGDARPGEALMLPVAEAAQWLASVSEDKVDAVEYEPTRIELRAGASKRRATTSPVQDGREALGGPTNAMEEVAKVKADLLATAFAQVKWAIAADIQTRHALDFVELSARGGEVRARATDGKKMAEARFPAPGGSEFSLLLDPKALVAVLGAVEGDVTIRAHNSAVRFDAGGASAWTLGANLPFPPCDQFLQVPEGAVQMDLDAGAFRAAVQRAALAMEGDKVTRGIDLSLDMGSLVIKYNADGRSAEDLLAVKTAAPKAEACIDGGFLLEALGGLSGPMSFWFGKNGGPNYVRCEARAGWTGLVMGMAT